MKEKISRRRFIGTTATGIVGISAGYSAKSYARISGANDRINMAFLGTGARSYGHRRMVQGSYDDKNMQAIAVCDIWKQNREKAAADCLDKFNTKVKMLTFE